MEEILTRQKLQRNEMNGDNGDDTMNWNGYDEINTEGERNGNNLDYEKKNLNISYGGVNGDGNMNDFLGMVLT